MTWVDTSARLQASRFAPTARALPSFQLTAERLSIGQKAGLGGDLGFMTAGELMAYGIHREMAVIDGLGIPVETPYGWHILLVEEERILEDTSRVMLSVADDIHRQRMVSARDSLLALAAAEREIFIDPALASQGHQNETDTGNEGSEIQ